MIAAKLSIKINEQNNVTYLLQLLILSLVYFVCGRVGLGLANINPSVSAVWPATGIAIAALLIWGYRVWPALFIGAFFVNLTVNGSFLISFGIACGNSLEAIFGVYFIKRLIPEGNIFFNPLNVVKYIFFTGIVATYISAAIGISSLYLGGYLKYDNILQTGLIWWLGDIGGALIIAPFLILWMNDYKIKWKLRKFIEFIAVILVVSFIIFYTFIDGIPTLTDLFPFIFITIPFIIFLAVRFSPRETATAILILYLITLWQTLNHLLPFIKGTSSQPLIMIHIFICILFIAFMPLAADVKQRKFLEESLVLKINQQQSISDFGLRVLSGNNLEAILKEAVEIIFNTLNVDYCKIQKLLLDEKEFLLIEGIGWKEGLIGKLRLSADLNSLAGYTLLEKKPVIVTDFSTENRFKGHPILFQHNITSSISCIIYGNEKPFGVIDAHSRTKMVFTKDDVFFFQSIANLLGMAIEKFSYEEQLLSSLHEKQILLKEIHHRVKNNLQIVTSLLNLQSLQVSDSTVLDILSKSKSRIKSMALIYKLLHNNENISKINFRDYLIELSDAISESFGSPQIKFHINAENIYLEPDQATNLGLIINEIVSNSLKHAFKGKESGCIIIELKRMNQKVELILKDDGIGFPPDFDINSVSTLGVQLINNLILQVPATLNLENDVGTKYILTFSPK